jgi:hypothetical protein
VATKLWKDLVIGNVVGDAEAKAIVTVASDNIVRDKASRTTSALVTGAADAAVAGAGAHDNNDTVSKIAFDASAADVAESTEDNKASDAGLGKGRKRERSGEEGTEEY